MVEYIETAAKEYKNKNNKRKINVIDGAEKEKIMSKENYKTAKALHKNEIKKLHADIRKHKLLIKQAKLTYKLSK